MVFEQEGEGRICMIKTSSGGGGSKGQFSGTVGSIQNDTTTDVHEIVLLLLQFPPFNFGSGNGAISSSFLKSLFPFFSEFCFFLPSVLSLPAGQPHAASNDQIFKALSFISHNPFKVVRVGRMERRRKTFRSNQRHKEY